MLNSYSSTRNYPYYKLIVLFADLLVVNSLYWALYALSDCLSWHILDLTDPHYWSRFVQPHCTGRECFGESRACRRRPFSHHRFSFLYEHDFVAVMENHGDLLCIVVCISLSRTSVFASCGSEFTNQTAGYRQCGDCRRWR